MDSERRPPDGPSGDFGEEPDDATIADEQASDEVGGEYDEATVADEQWPVAEQYRVRQQPPADEDDGTVVVQQGVPPTYDSRRRFPPDFGPGLLAALAAVLLLLLLIPTGFWLASRDDDEGGTTTTSEPTTTDITTDTETTTTPTTPSTIAVPDATGVTLAEARRKLEGAGFEVRFRRVESERPPGEVLRQQPRAASEQPRGTLVVLSVSRAAAGIAVPDVVGSDLRAARQTLRAAGLEPRTRRVASTEPTGTVVEQDPAAGERVERDSIVVLDVARGEETPETTQPTEPVAVTVPRLIGSSASDARTRLRQLGLRSTQRSVASNRPAGTVVDQSPRAGSELKKGSTVTLEVSSGPARVSVPDVVGLDEAAARTELASAGFRVQVVDEPTAEPTEDGLVLEQSPQAGTTAREGTVVTLTVARLQ